MYKTYLIIVTIWLTFSSCSEKKALNLGGPVETQYPLLFDNSRPFVSDHKITCSFQLRARDEGDSLFLAIRVENNSDDTLKLNPGDLQLETSNNIRSDASWYDVRKLVVPPKSANTAKFKFLPCNSLLFYDRTNYKGDMDSVYSVNINFIHKSNKQRLFGEKVLFSLSKDMYSKYKDKFGKDDKITLFQIKNRNEVKNAVISYTEKLNLNKKRNIENEPGNVEISGTNMLINGVVMDINFYYLDSGLYLNTKILNHGKYMLVICPGQFIINDSDRSIAPQILSVHNSVQIEKNHKYPIIKGGRFELNVRYAVHNRLGFSLDMNGLTYNSMPKKLFPIPVSFIVDTIKP